MITDNMNKCIIELMKQKMSYVSAKYWSVIFIWAVVFLVFGGSIGLTILFSTWYGIIPVIAFWFLFITQNVILSSLIEKIKILRIIQNAQIEQISLLTEAVRLNGRRTTNIERVFKRLFSSTTNKETLH